MDGVIGKGSVQIVGPLLVRGGQIAMPVLLIAGGIGNGVEPQGADGLQGWFQPLGGHCGGSAHQGHPGPGKERFG